MRKMRLDRKSKAKVMAQLKELTLKMKKENTGGEEAEFAFGCLDAKASRKHGRLRIELNHRRTKQYVEVEEDDHA